MTDQGIIQLYWNRDERAIQETDTVYGAYCRTISGTILCSDEDAEECVNDTYLHTWNAIPPQRPDKLRAFLGRICRNLSVDRVRKKAAKKRGGGEWNVALEEMEMCVPGGEEPEQVVENDVLAKSLEAFVRALPERERILFLRRYYYLQPVSDLAAACGLRENTVNVTLHRIRAKLKLHLEREGFGL